MYPPELALQQPKKMHVQIRGGEVDGVTIGGAMGAGRENDPPAGHHAPDHLVHNNFHHHSSQLDGLCEGQPNGGHSQLIPLQVSTSGGLFPRFRQDNLLFNSGNAIVPDNSSSNSEISASSLFSLGNNGLNSSTALIRGDLASYEDFSASSLIGVSHSNDFKDSFSNGISRSKRESNKGIFIDFCYHLFEFESRCTKFIRMVFRSNFLQILT